MNDGETEWTKDNSWTEKIKMYAGMLILTNDDK